MMFESGQLLDARYALTAAIGEGSMASVWQAEDLILRRQVAIKFLPADDTPDGQLMIERFLREARIAASVQHRNVIHTTDFGTHDRQPFMVMELLDGESLRDRLSRSPRMTQHRVMHVISLTLRGLAAIHDAGVVHRDLKPGNIFLQSDSHTVYPKIIDFGVAISFSPDDKAALSVIEPRQGFVAGTPEYMSPEQARGDVHIDLRSDIYSMGVILYEALTGQLPFESDSVQELLAHVQGHTPATVSELAPEVPRVFSDLVAKAMSRPRRVGHTWGSRVWRRRW